MDSLRQLWARLAGLFHRRRLEREMAEEMRQHLERRRQEKIAEGLTPDEAHYAAQREFGGMMQVQEQCRDERRFVWLEQLAQDLRYAARVLRQNPGFTAVIVLTLAVGIATATTMFNFYSAELMRPMPFLRDESSLLRIRAYKTKAPADDFNLSALDFQDLRARLHSVNGALVVWNRTFVVGGDEQAERAAGSVLTADGFETLGVQPALGRSFRAEEGKPGAAEVVLLSHALWQRAFGGRRDIIGQTITLNRQPTTVIGIMPEGFGFPINSAIWQPWRADSALHETERANRGYYVFARMGAGTTLTQVQAELDGLARQLAQEHPAANGGVGFRAFLLRDEATRGDRPMLQLVLGAALVIWLIACVNIASLILARAASRTREIGLRAALGASRGRIVRQFLTESMLLGLLGGAASAPLAAWEKSAVSAFTPFTPPYWLRFEPDWRVFAFAAGATLCTIVTFGLIPAWLISRRDLAPALQDGGRTASGGGAALRARRALVVGQTALALVLLVVGGLMVRSLFHLRNAELGFDPNAVLTFRTGMSASVERDPAGTVRFFQTIEARLRELPGVEGAGFISYLPMQANSRDDGFVIEGRPELGPGERQFALVRAASPGALGALKVPLHRGRFFDARDVSGAPLVAVVDQAFVEKYFSGENPIGRRLAFDQPAGERKPPEWLTIIGVIGTVRQHATARGQAPNIWMPLAQSPDNFMDAVVRMPGVSPSFERGAQATVRAVRSDVPVFNLNSMPRVVRDAIGWERILGGLFACFAGIALLLAAIGLYGLMAYSVIQRTREIGVRLALGARPAGVAAMFLRQGARLVAVGLGIGLVAAWFVGASIANLLHGIDAHDATTFVLVPLLLTLVAATACWLPARRALKIDPIIALRCE